MRLSVINVGLLVTLGALVGCGAGETSSEAAGRAEDSAAAAKQSEALSVGSQGEQVQQLHAYLTAFGYFPNVELERNYPAWRPVVKQAPADANVFDANTEAAVRAFQRNYGLVESGKVDASVREMMAKPRGGDPDNIVPPDASEKFDVSSSRWSTNALTWKVVNGDDGISTTDVANRVSYALDYWRRGTGFTFTQVTGSAAADILIQFSPMTSPAGGTVLGSTYFPPNGDVTLNSNVAWSVASTTPSGSMDLASILIHELGHSLGITHSSYTNSIMYGVYPGWGIQKRSLTADDWAAKYALNMSWVAFDTGFGDLDVAWYTHPNGSETYMIGGDTGGADRQIWLLRDMANWEQLPGAAVRVAAGPEPWVVNSSGGIFRMDWSSGNWVQMPGCAHDIGIGSDNSVWVIGCAQSGNDYLIYKWNGSDWDQTDGAAVRIAVGPSSPGGQNVPWVVNSGGGIYRRTSGSPTSGYWVQLPGSATDIGVGADGYAWSIGTTAVGGGYNIQVWNEQPADPTGTIASPPAVAQAKWITVPGGAVAIAVASGGTPFVVNNAGDAFWPAQ